MHPLFSISALIILGTAAALVACPQPMLAQAAPSPAQAQPLSQFVAPQLTPYQRNPSIFQNSREAIQALDNPRLMLRRSAVEWLANWTAVDSGFHAWVTQGNNIVDAVTRNSVSLEGRTSLIPKLSRAIRELPDDDSQQAARLLVLIGPSARSAIPVVCAALIKQGTLDAFKRYNLLATLMHLCGGPDAVAPTLKALMQDKDPETRRLAAGAAGLCDDLGFEHISIVPIGADRLTPAQSLITTEAFQALMIPALTEATQDSNTGVRLAALKSLENQTQVSSMISQRHADYFEDAWQRALPSLAQDAASHNPQVRLATLRVLAFLPVDVSSIAASLRPSLHGSSNEQNYALTVLGRASQQNRLATVISFLKDLTSTDISKRRQASADIHLAAIPLWSSAFLPNPYPLPDGWRYVIPRSDQSPEAETAQRKATKEAMKLFLTALVKAASDSDAPIRRNVAKSLEDIGKSTYFWEADRNSQSLMTEEAPQVAMALAQAADVIQPHDALLAEQLRAMEERVKTGPLNVL